MIEQRTALLKPLPFSIAEIRGTTLPESIDLLLLTGFYPRIKAGATIAADFFKGVTHFSRLIGGLPHGGGLVYGGRETRQQGLFHIHPATDVEEMLLGLNHAGFAF